MDDNDFLYEGNLKYIDYNIEGNQIRAFYDKSNLLVCVFDYTTSDIKKNTLLIINPDGTRKWDDILSNDYNITLENIRPKENNKYQKLDIEYNGLDIYNTLINKYNDNDNIDNILIKLEYFRNNLLLRIAIDRLNSAEDIANKSRNTIDTTYNKISEYEELIEKLKYKLKNQKKDLSEQGIEKRLKTENRIEKTETLLKRSNKRLKRAKSRLKFAENDIIISRDIIKKINEKEIQMPTEEVKPLLDKDPEIYDEKIAFKPVNLKDDTQDDFVLENEETNEKKSEESTDEDKDFMDFISSLSKQDNENSEEETYKDNLEQNNQNSDNKNNHINDEIEILKKQLKQAEEEANKLKQDLLKIKEENNKNQEQVLEENNITESTKEIIEQTNLERPSSPNSAPINNNNNNNNNNNIENNTKLENKDIQKQPTLLYYCMLVVLIFLSIFTLWLYQKKSVKNIPNITAVIENSEIQENEIKENQNIDIPTLPLEKEENIEDIKQEDFVPQQDTINQENEQHQEEHEIQDIENVKPEYNVSHDNDIFISEENDNLNTETVYSYDNINTSEESNSDYLE